MSEPFLTTSELVKAYVQGLRRTLEAASVSLFLPPAPGDRASVLVHDGVDPAPELSSVEEARALVLPEERSLPKGMSAPRFIPSKSKECQLVVVPIAHSTPIRRHPEATPERRAFDPTPSPPWTQTWIGLRFSPGARRSEEDLRHLEPLFAFAGTLARHSRRVSKAIEDPLTALPARAEFLVQLRHSYEAARRIDRPLTLFLVNPDGFTAVNEKFGWDAGDRVISEIAFRLTATLRFSDVVAKYGSAIFSVLTDDVGRDAAQTVGDKIRRGLAERAFLDGSLELGFSIGSSSVEPRDEGIRDTLTLIRRADLALSVAKQAGGDRCEHWCPELETRSIGPLDRLNGIFTGDMQRDYRNMALLSDTVSAVASSENFDELSKQLSERLFALLKADRVVLLGQSHEDKFTPMHAVVRDKNGAAAWAPSPVACLDHDQQLLVEEAARTGRAVEAGMVQGTLAGAQIHSFAIPLVSRGECPGCLYLDGRADRIATDSADLVFLEALGSQLAVAFDRARLTEQERQWQRAERDRLVVQLDELRDAVQQAKLVYRSEAMKSLLETAQRAAKTDATVLVTGESGTGKELVARSVHQLSQRRDKPVVVVDCASVATTLIESELFGHERGAYTGAEQRRIGRLVEADAGTVILDEIGELPLEVQGKLLRFVQEKEVVPVGGTRPRTVDARVVAVTNRDLKEEARSGRFREDLYHRLNVVQLHVPPLSERPEDILYLANHILQKFSVQYKKGILRCLTRRAEALMLRYPWPGNVRELQNRILQAVILSEGIEIDFAQLGLAEEDATGVVRQTASSAPPTTNGSDVARSETRPGSDHQELFIVSDTWRQLRGALSQAVDAALNGNTRTPAPLGKWLLDDLVLEAHAESGNVMRRGAGRLGIPEATFRRRLRNAQRQRAAGIRPRPPFWDEVQGALRTLVASNENAPEDLLRHARDVMLSQVVDRLPEDVSIASALMGVTEPTYRRWKSEVAVA